MRLDRRSFLAALAALFGFRRRRPPLAPGDRVSMGVRYLVNPKVADWTVHIETGPSLFNPREDVAAQYATALEKMNELMDGWNAERMVMLRDWDGTQRLVTINPRPKEPVGQVG